MAITDTINIDFQHLKSSDPKVLIIIDTSVWGVIENKRAVIEIITPGATKPVTYIFAKNKSNVFNSSNLYLSGTDSQCDLPDGLYKITVKGSPDKYCKFRYILKDDITRLKLYNLRASLGFEDEYKDSDLKDVIKKSKFYLDTANAAIVVGKPKKAMTFLTAASEILDKYENCKNYK